MVAVQDLEQELANVLHYSASPGLEELRDLDQARSIPGVDSVYKVNGIPVAYFSRIPDVDDVNGYIYKLYKSIWNESTVPLLYVFLPTEIRVYNIYTQPAKDADELSNDKAGKSDRLLKHLENISDLTDARNKIRDELLDYERTRLDTGTFWITVDGKKVKREQRADQLLLGALNQLRVELLKLGLTKEVTFALISRTIFIRYLEDRGMLTTEQVAKAVSDDVPDLLEALRKGKDTTYALFDYLSVRFNGGLFPKEQADKNVVEDRHLKLLRQFLAAEVNKQLSFWPYNFKYIPVELISGIYEAFLDKPDQKKGGSREQDSVYQTQNEQRSIGAYYTPPSLANFVLQWTLPLEDANITNSKLTILDPACGSGIFLVRSFHRLVASWRREHNREHPSADDLSHILLHSIYGVDISDAAIAVAKFSLYLAMLDHLKEEDVRDRDLHFPSLDEHLIHMDFFHEKVESRLHGIKFDRIIGNLPWGKDTLKQVGEEWVQSRGFEIVGRQASQAFLIRMLDFCAPDGEIAVLAPTRGTLATARGESFRKAFWSQVDVRSIINFSALVNELFSDARSPAIAIFYRKKSRQPTSAKLTYGAPKPSLISRQLGAIVLDNTELKYLHKDEFQNDPVLWKIAMWGTERDVTLIHLLQDQHNQSTLESVMKELHWEMHEGITRGTKENKKSAPWLQGLPLLETELFRRYVPDSDLYQPVEGTLFQWPRNPEQFQPPLALVKLNPIEGDFAAAFTSNSVVYLHTVAGVKGQIGQEDLLKWLVIVLNSRLAQYYLFLTSTVWGIERSILLQGEFKQMPFFIPDQDSSSFQQALEHFDAIVSMYQQSDPLYKGAEQLELQRHQAALEELVFAIYGLTSQEQQMVKDMVDYGIGFFYWSKRRTRKLQGAPSVQQPQPEMLREYAETFIAAATELLKYQHMTLNGTVYHDGQPLSVLGFEIVGEAERREVRMIRSSDALRTRLRELDNRLIHEDADSIYTRRHIRIYEGSHIDLVRPSEQRFWTQSQARADATGMMADLLRQSRTRRTKSL